MNINRLRAMTTPGKQLYAAKCLDAYCLHFGIADYSIDLLIEHLYAMKECEDLSRWERVGAGLPLSGRDPLPEFLEVKIPEKNRAEFSKLVTCAVEVGVADMYAAPSEEPMESLLECIEILNQNGVALPPTADIEQEEICISQQLYIETLNTIEKVVHILHRCSSRDDADNFAYSLAITCCDTNLLDDLVKVRSVLYDLISQEEYDELGERGVWDLDVEKYSIPYDMSLEELRERLKPYIRVWKSLDLITPEG